MAKKGIYFVGIDALVNKMKSDAEMKAVKEIVKTNTIELDRKMKRAANFKGHYNGSGKFIPPTGATRRSIAYKISSSGLTGIVAPKTLYSFYLEFGTRFMMAQPFVGPAFRQQKSIFLSDIKKLVR